MSRKLIVTAGAIAVLALSGGGAALAVSAGDDDGDVLVTGSAAEAASAAALRITEGGTVNAVERDAEKGATWEVEVRRRDGSIVDVRLDAGYALVAIDGDVEEDD